MQTGSEMKTQKWLSHLKEECLILPTVYFNCEETNRQQVLATFTEINSVTWQLYWQITSYTWDKMCDANTSTVNETSTRTANSSSRRHICVWLPTWVVDFVMVDVYFSTCLLLKVLKIVFLSLNLVLVANPSYIWAAVLSLCLLWCVWPPSSQHFYYEMFVPGLTLVVVWLWVQCRHRWRLLWAKYCGQTADTAVWRGGSTAYSSCYPHWKQVPTRWRGDIHHFITN